MARIYAAAAGTLAVGLLTLAVVLPQHGSNTQRTSRAVAAASVQPLAFEPSAGRFRSVDYLVRGSGSTLAINSTRSVLGVGPHGAQLTTSLAGAAASANATPGSKLPGKVNWYAGSDKSRYRTGLPTYAGVTYRGVYPGIDLRYTGHQGRLEYDFLVGRGADPSRVAMNLSGASRLRIAANGDLLARVGGQTLRQLRPVAYQLTDGKRTPVPAQFDLQGNRISFGLGGYDHSRPLVIDPVLAYSDYVGGTGSESFADVATDSGHNAIAVGFTSSPSIPGFSGGSSSGGVGLAVKIAPDGTRVWATYLGTGLNGVAVDGSDNVALAGTGYNAIGASSGTDALVARLNPNGGELWHQFVGPTTNTADSGDAITTDRVGNIYLAGTTVSSSGIASGAGFDSSFGGVTDGFLILLSPTGTRTWGTYLGGSTYDGIYGVGVQPSCASSCPAYVGGYTQSTNATSGLGTAGTSNSSRSTAVQDGFVTRVNASGAKAWSTFTPFNPVDGCGGVECSSTVYGLAVSPAGNPTAVGSVGQTNGTSDPWIGSFFAASGQRGPDPSDTSFDIAASGGYFHDVAYDAFGNAYAIGEAGGTFATQDPVQGNYGGGARDAFAMKFAGNRVASFPIWATYLGGAQSDYGNGIAADGNGGVFLVGDTTSTNFPTVGAKQGPGGGQDAFVARIDLKIPKITGGPSGTSRSHDAAFTYGDGEGGGYQCRLTGEQAFSDCPAGGKTYTGLPDGNYTFEVRALDVGGTPSAAASQSFTINTQPLASFTIAPNPTLTNRAVSFDATASTGGASTITKYEWDINGDGQFDRDTGTTAKTGEAYPKAGTVPVSLRITTASGATAVSTQNLIVSAATGPAQFGVTINNGAQYTRTPNVTVTSNFPASTTDLLLANDGGFLAAQSFPAAKTLKWKLDSSGPERLPKIVYVRFLSGSIVSETHIDDIILDETPPKVDSAAVQPVAGASSAAARVATAAKTKLHKWRLKVKAHDSNSGVSKLQATSNKRKPGKAIKYKKSLIVKAATKPRWIRAQDRAGNWSKWKRAR